MKCSRLNSNQTELLKRVLVELKSRAQDVLKDVEDPVRKHVLDNLDAVSLLCGQLLENRSNDQAFPGFNERVNHKRISPVKKSLEKSPNDHTRGLAVTMVQMMRAMKNVATTEDTHALSTENNHENVQELADQFLRQVEKESVQNTQAGNSKG